MLRPTFERADQGALEVAGPEEAGSPWAGNVAAYACRAYCPVDDVHPDCRPMATTFAQAKPYAWLYVLKILLGALISWFGLQAMQIERPYWAMITICIASDPDLETARTVALARFLNTLVGGAVGLTGVMIGGLRPLTMFICLAITTALVTTIPKYPANWRLAPATVVIIMEVAAIEGTSRATEMRIAEQRLLQVCVGCAVALALAWVFSWSRRLFSRA
jgi:uncharacterized membrane protein YccC